MILDNTSIIRIYFLSMMRLVSSVLMVAPWRTASRRMCCSSRLVAGRLVAGRLVAGLAAVFFFFGFFSSSFSSSKVIFSQSPQDNAPSETIGIFLAADCVTPKTAWNLGETACAVVTGVLEDRRIAWIAPDGTIAQVSDYLSGTVRDSYQLQTGSDVMAQVGTWRISIIDNNGVASAAASFVVRDPHHPSADLSLSAFAPSQTSAGSDTVYRLEVTNRGPNDAQHVTLTNVIPPSTTFVSQAQNSGPNFTCSNPPAGDAAGAINCTIAALPSGSTAVFTFVFKVDLRAAADTEIASEAAVTSETNELREADNTAKSSTSVLSSTPPCTIACPANITRGSDPNEAGAIVSYKTPTTSGDCAVDAEGSESSENEVVCNPPSGSFFPVGTTVVTCSTIGGGSCSFTVTVHYNFKGFSPPISNLPEVNLVDAGSAIPVKFSLSGDKGLSIFAEGFPALSVITCEPNDAPTEIQQIVTADNSNLSYDAKSDQYQYLWKTESTWAGTCRQLVIKLNDGSEHRASFRFK